jgi:tRNA threonylcarbamoyladenosine biosynthesis protein TsaB
MVLLAIETVTRHGSLALVTGRGCETRVGGVARTHAERLPGDALALLADHGCALADVDRFVVVAGPGSFTGLRVGLAAVQGFAVVTGRRVAPVPTLDAIAEGWRLRHGAARAGGEPLVVACLDGQRGEIFFAAWRVRADQPLDVAEVAIAPGVGRPAELVARVSAQAGAAGLVVVGVNMAPHHDALAPLGVPIETVETPLAETAAAIAARRPELAVSPHALRPLYIRRPDAEIARERAGLTPR